MLTQGDRVLTKIDDPSRFAVGAAESLNNQAGTVEEVKEHSMNGKFEGREYGEAVLVRLDKTPRPWWTHQRPSNGFWFRSEDLTKTGRIVKPASVGMPGTLEPYAGAK